MGVIAKVACVPIDYDTDAFRNWAVLNLRTCCSLQLRWRALHHYSFMGTTRAMHGEPHGDSEGDRE
jgi:hypothetical protein